MKVLTLDLETTPNLAHVWQLWGQQNIGLNQLIESSELLCAAAKWHGGDEIMFVKGPSYDLTGVDKLHAWVSEADAIVTWNGDKFDIPHLNREFIEHGFAVPPPVASIDLLKTARKVFRFPSNKLDYVAGRLLGVNKHKHTGHQLWVDCMANDASAWDLMETYNKTDVRITEQLYDKLLPWITTHPNVRLYNGMTGCPRCGSERLHKRGYKTRGLSIYQQYQCQACGGWFRDTKRIDGSSIC